MAEPLFLVGIYQNVFLAYLIMTQIQFMQKSKI